MKVTLKGDDTLMRDFMEMECPYSPVQGACSLRCPHLSVEGSVVYGPEGMTYDEGKRWAILTCGGSQRVYELERTAPCGCTFGERKEVEKNCGT